MTREEYTKAQENCGLKVGDKVRIIRKAASYENGWNNNWAHYMDMWVGEIAEIREIHNLYGVWLYNEDLPLDSYYFPYFVLEKVSNQPSLPIPQPVSQNLWNTTLLCTFNTPLSKYTTTPELSSSFNTSSKFTNSY